MTELERIVKLFIKAYKNADDATHDWLNIAGKNYPPYIREKYKVRMHKADDTLHKIRVYMFKYMEGK